MKWISAALCIIIWYGAQSQTNIWKGGSYDGSASSVYNNPNRFSMWTGGINDGSASTEFINTNSFSIWNGGLADGAASEGYTNPNNFSIWKGGQGDGFAWGSSVRVCSNPIVMANTSTTNVTQTTATFSWNTFNYGSSYTILIRRDSCTGPPVASTPPGICALGLNTVVITGLTPGTHYCITLQEHCGGGSSTAESNGSSFTTIPTDCNPPTALQHLGNTGSSVRLGWTPGYSNTSFQIMLIKQGTTDTFWHSGNITGSFMRDTIKCLPTGSFFNYYIRESCGYSATGHSQWINGFTTYTSTGCSVPTNQTASIVNTQNANLSWTDNTFNATPYQISYGVGISNAEQGTKTAITVPTLISGTAFTHALFLSGGVGNITWYVRQVCGQCDTTDWTGPHTLSANSCNVAAVNGMSVTSLAATSAMLNFISTNYNSASKIELLNTSNNNTELYNLAVNASYTRSQALSGLTPNTNYSWRVKEYCSANDSTANSVWQNFTTPANSGSACNAPANQGVYVQSGNVLIVKWSSLLYGDAGKQYVIAAGMNIGSPAQATIFQGNAYYISQTPAFATHYFADGNHPGFTWYVRDVCAPGDSSAWVGPYILGSSKTDETGNSIVPLETPVANNLLLQLFPNPNNGKEVNIEAIGFGETVELLIYNLQSEIVGAQLLKPDGITQVDVSMLGNAVYLCRVISPQYQRTLRLVIQR